VTACLLKVRWPMLEPYEAKVSRTVLGGRGGSNASSLPDHQTAAAILVRLDIKALSAAAGELDVELNRFAVD